MKFQNQLWVTFFLSLSLIEVSLGCETTEEDKIVAPIIQQDIIKQEADMSEPSNNDVLKNIHQNNDVDRQENGSTFKDQFMRVHNAYKALKEKNLLIPSSTLLSVSTMFFYNLWQLVGVEEITPMECAQNSFYSLTPMAVVLCGCSFSEIFFGNIPKCWQETKEHIS